MKWLKHMCNASDDDFIEMLEDKFGLEGYARWWKILETIGKAMEKNRADPSAEHSWSKWQKILSGQRNKLKIFLEYLATVPETFGEQSANAPKIKITDSGNVLKITCPNMLKFRDEYSRKSGQSPVATPDKVAPDTDTEEEKEKEKKESKATGSRFALTALPDEWKEFCNRERPELNPEKLFAEFGDYWRAVPGQKGRKTDWLATWRNRVRDYHQKTIGPLFQKPKQTYSNVQRG